LQSAHESTEPGKVLGTPNYMAPEQVRGEPVDHRADLFAFGCVLYEMVSGQRPFKRDTSIATMAAIMSDEPPDLAATRPDISTALVRLVHRCLEKQPDNRFQSAKDLAFAIESAGALSTSSHRALHTEHTRANLKHLLPWAVALVAILVAVGTLFYKRSESFRTIASSNSVAVSSAPLLKLEIRLPAPAHPKPGEPDGLKGLAISPDGGKLAYVNADGLYWRWLDRLSPPTLLSSGQELAGPFWSPDSTALGWAEGLTLMRAPIAGGRPMVVCRIAHAFNGGGAAWLEQGEIIYTCGGTGLFRVAAQGGIAELVLPPAEGELDYHEATTVPGGRGVVFVIHRKEGGPDAIGAWNPKDGINGRKIVLHLPGSVFQSPTVSSSGYVLCADRGPTGTEGIWAIPLSLTSLEHTREPVRLADDGSFLSVSAQGTLAISWSADNLGFFGPRQLVWIDHSGKVESPVGSVHKGLIMPRLSPDGGLVAFSSGDRPSAFRVRILDVTRGSELPFQQGADAQDSPFWLPDGRRIALNTYQAGPPHGVIRAVDGSGTSQQIGLGFLQHLSASGRYAFLDRRGQTNLHGFIDLAGHGNKWIDFPPELGKWGAGFNQRPSLSPNDGLLAFESPENNQSHVYVVAFPGFTNRVLVSRGGGQNPQWSRDGSELFYLRADGKAMMSVTASNTNGSSFGEPVKLFDLPDSIYLHRRLINQFDVSGDGQRFLMIQKVKEGEGASTSSEPTVLLIQNWVEELRGKK